MINKQNPRTLLTTLITHTAIVVSVILSYVLVSRLMTASAITTLNPGDIYIITANSDFAYPGVVNSNGFDFVSRVDLDPGTEIYFADKGWDGSLPTPFWRNTTGEGTLRYTVPAGGITAGTIIHYDDTNIPTLPSSGSSTWDMYSIDPITGAMALSTNSGSGFDPSTTGDNILVFQGSAASPNFLYGIGWSATTTWITTGTPTANNSYAPSGISTGAGTVNTLGSTDNYQYNCTMSGIFSSTFTTDLQNVLNWNSDNTTPYGASTCTFDASRPQATIAQVFGQNDPTNNNSISFSVTFDQAINPASFTIGDLTLSGTGSGAISSLITSDNIVWTVNVSAATEGTIIISLPSNLVTDPNGNPNPVTINTDNSVLYDTTPPATLAAPDMTSATDSGTSSSDNITNNTTPEFTGACVDGDTITIIIDGSAISPTAVCASSSYQIVLSTAISEGNHSVQVTATDPSGNLSAVSSNTNVTIDTIAPSCNINQDTSFEQSPEITGYVDDSLAQVQLIIDGNSYNAVNSGNNFTLNSGTIAPALNIDQTYSVTIECVDIAGNASSSLSNLTILRHVDLSVAMQITTPGIITSGQTATYEISIVNVDTFAFNDLDNLFFYILSPSVLNPGVNPGDLFPVSNPGIECAYIGDAGTISGDVWGQYAGNNVFQCGFNNPTVLNPGETFSFNVSYVASSDLPNGLINRVLIYDDNNIDPDSSVISDVADNDGDIYAINLNSVASATYTIPVAPTPNTTPSPTISKPNSLAKTGTDSTHILPLVLLLVIITTGIQITPILVRKNSN